MMKKSIVLVLALLPLLGGCKKDDAGDVRLDVREVAWNWLGDEAKATVTVEWKNAPVTDAEYGGKVVYAVCFNTKDDALLGPIVVYVDKDTLVVLGQCLRL